MPKIIPIKDLKDTASVSLMVRENAEPVYVTKNGYEDMVVMSMEVYRELTDEIRRLKAELEITQLIDEGLFDISRGDTVDAFESLEELRRKYNLRRRFIKTKWE